MNYLNKFKKIIIFVSISLWLVVSNCIFAADSTSSNLLDTVYNDSKDSVVNVSGDEMLEWKSSVLVRSTNFLLQVTIAVAVTMVLYGSLMIVTSAWNDAKMKKARNNIILVAVWVVLALSSVLLVTIIESISKSSIP